MWGPSLDLSMLPTFSPRPLLGMCVRAHVFTCVSSCGKADVKFLFCSGLRTGPALLRPGVFPAAVRPAESVTCTHNQDPEPFSVHSLCGLWFHHKSLLTVFLTLLGCGPLTNGTHTEASVSAPAVSSYCLSGGFLVKYHGKGEKPKPAGW